MKQILLLILTLFTHVAHSQDVILLKTGEEIKSKVLDVAIHDIKYKKVSNADGPTYTIEKSKVFMITYENGTKDIFKDSPTVTDGTITSKGTRIFRNGIRLTGEEIRELYKQSPKSLSLYNSSKPLTFFGILCGVIGGGIVGWELGTAAAGETIDGVTTGIGLGIMTGGIIMGFAADNNVKKSVTLYNANKGKITHFNVNFGLQSKGIGFAMNF